MKGNTKETIIFGQLRSVGYYENEVVDEAINLDLSKFDSGVSFRSAYKFENVTFNQFFKFFNSHSISHPVRFEFINCTFKTKAYFQNIDSEMDSLYFENCNLGNEFKVENTKLSYIEMKNCSGEIVYFKKTEGHLQLDENTIEEELLLLNTKGYYCDIKNLLNPIEKIKVNSENQEFLRIRSNAKIKNLEISELIAASIEGDYDSIVVSSEKFEEIEIQPISRIESGRNLNQASVATLKIHSAKISGSLIIENLDIGNLNFLDVYSSNGIVRMNEVNAITSSFDGCVIKDFYWTQLTFKNPPEILGGDLSLLRMANVDWPKGHLLKDSFLKESIFPLYRIRKMLFKCTRQFSENEISLLKYERDAYRQLKVASFGSQNTIEALKFYKNEMNAYWKEIRITGKEKWHDSFLVFLGRWSSNFGQSWVLPLLWITIVTGSYYFLVDQPELSYCPKNIGNGILEALYYINPVRKIDTEAPRTIQGLDVLFRVLNAYFIYHFIKASRKFGKV